MSKSTPKLNVLLFAPEVRLWVSLVTMLGFAIRAIVGQPALAQSIITEKAVTAVVMSASKTAILPAKEDTAPIQEAVKEPSDAVSVRTVLTDVCQKRGYGDECAKTLLGMSWKESQFINTAVGDNGKAHGYFQIHYKLHKIPLSCAEDLRCSANWTISYLEWNNYKTNPKAAIQCHNGCGVNNGYAASVIRHGNRLWQETSEQANVPLAMK